MNQITEIDEGRRVLIEAIDRYSLAYPDEVATIERFNQFVSRVPGCFERTTTEGHITGSAWLLNPTGSCVLLTQHRKLGKWLQVGGHADGESDVVSVALTEAREESGILDLEVISTEIFDLDIHVIPSRGVDLEHLHYDVRYAVRANHTAHAVSAESLSLAWVDVFSIHDYTTEESMLRMAQKWNALRKELGQ